MNKKLKRKEDTNKKKSLSTKMFLLFLSIITIVVVILGVFSSIITSKSMQSSIEQQLKQNTNQTSQIVEESIKGVENCVNILSLDKGLALNASGSNKDIEDDNNYLKTIQLQHSGLIETLVVTDSLGKVVVSSGDVTGNIDLSDREYVKKALEGEKNVSNILLSKVTQKPIMAIAYPLKYNDKIVGTVVGTIKFDSICKDVAKVKVGESGYAYMIDKNGLIVYHPKNEKILKENAGETTNVELKALVDKMKSGKTDSGYYTYEGAYKFVSFTPVNNFVVVITANYDEYMAPARAIRINTVIIGVIALIISVALSYLFTTRNIIRPIKHLEDLMIKAGDGDLTGRADIRTRDEIQTLGEYFNGMIEHQTEIIANVRKGSEELTASSEEISASSEEINTSTEEITSSIQEVAANAENQNNSIIETSEVLVQLSSLVQIAQNRACTAKNNSENTMSVAKEGRVKVNRTVAAIKDINKVTTETAEILEVLNELSKKVNGIISTINNISTQTNLLALNAAIEAARAGEHGKGFTVVADEVRKLSEQTNIGSNEISSLVNEMVMEIDKAVKSMSIGKQAVDNGVVIASETDDSFINIISAVEQIVKDINSIADVTRDEVASSDKIVKLIDSVATIAETTVAHSEEVSASTEEQSAAIQNLAASAEETSAMANSLNNLVEKFMIKEV
ncbi:methyl-accepting chemotaxis sensory transducer with Cache sensor [Clostridium cavendishii DSM 21758]|uniref:Methyl-accepting chemotaxis sensory transducer with Cache sensor n=1 Tax=Clostridium cavendishii DSM 21758 TaxID=1121302 RepID=A0A1M6UG93_9CLOT|nr:methyl-accepting chemotaxis protein [Clostridium cavendishii]SHK68242.1 methyl-accepting chemotaxis sensory transducer with Cache sensor [Clostridium cavendishii DSM 21758]